MNNQTQLTDIGIALEKIQQLKQQLEEAVEVVDELNNIVLGHLENGDKLDSFTLQPSRQFLAKYLGEK